MLCALGSRYTWLLCAAQSNDERKALDEREDFNTEEARILDLLARGLSREFPNPLRAGCPPSAILKGMAHRQLGLAEVRPWLDHLSSCSPCFEEFTAMRAQAVRLRHSRQIVLAVAAVLIFVIAGWLWVRTRQQLQTPDTATLDLRDYSFARGTDSPQTKPPPLELHRSAKHVVLDLPVGSGEGSYEVALLDQTGSELLKAAGTAQMENQITTLRPNLDLSTVQPGLYSLALRRPGLEWTRYPVRVH